MRDVTPSQVPSAHRGQPLRHELRAVARLATPIVAVQVGMMLMGVTDSMMLGRVSELALAAGALGHSVGFALLIFPMGVLMALDPLVAQAYGAGDERRIGTHLKRGLILATLLTLPLAVIFWFSRGLLDLLGQPPELAELAAGYLRALILGALPFQLYSVLRQTLQAMSLIRQTLLAIVIANVANVAANYALIYGHWGFPALGVVGSGLATSISRWVMFVTLLVLSRSLIVSYWRQAGKVRLHSLLPLLRIGLPIGFQLSLEMWLFTAVALIMGTLGASELAGHQIALMLAAMTFMVPLGIGAAAATRVGNAIGRGDMPAARLSAKATLVTGTGVMTLSAFVFWTFPEPLSRLFTPEPTVLAVAVTLVPIAALFQVFDGLQVVAAGVLRGSADTRFPALIALIGYWVLGLPFGYLLCFRWGFGPSGLWWGLTAGLASVGVLLLFRLRSRFAGDIAALEDSGE